jgi:dipeptidase D
MTLEGLEPKVVWKHFDAIRRIPHCSGNEDELAKYLLDFAAGKGLEARKDSYGNVRISALATEGRENVPPLILQCHIDMVCENDAGVRHDFSKDPIELVLDGDWLSAKGTTLGADNGVGAACALALVDTPRTAHGPLELLFTVEEEIGLVGASKLKPGFVEGKRLLNLDSEELGAIYVGCAGGSTSNIVFRPRWVKPDKNARGLTVTVGGLRGGHSGIDIDKPRGNAVRILAEVVKKLAAQGSCRLASVSGGNKLNAIPREAVAVLAVGGNETVAEASAIAKAEAGRVTAMLGGTADSVRITAASGVEKIERVMDDASQERLTALLLELPNGVQAMSAAIPDLVETSNNVATVSVSGDTVLIGTMARSSAAEALEVLEQRIDSVAGNYGATVEVSERYPGWKPDLESPLLASVKQSYAGVLGKEPDVKAIHAGLECGIIGERFPGLDMASIGPTVEAPHSPGERVDVKSVETFWKVLVAIVGER